MKEMSKTSYESSYEKTYYGAPPSAPPSYTQAVGGVPPASPYIPHYEVVKDKTIVTTVVPVGSHRTHMICPHCHAEIETTTAKKPSLLAYIVGSLLCCGGCFCGCCLIPCCMDDCMNVVHTCPNCNSYLGFYQSPKYRL